MNGLQNLYNRGLVLEEDISGLKRISVALDALRYDTLIACAAYGRKQVHSQKRLFKHDLIVEEYSECLILQSFRGNS